MFAIYVTNFGSRNRINAGKKKLNDIFFVDYL